MITTLTTAELIAVGFFIIVVMVNMAIGLSIILGSRIYHRQAMAALKGMEAGYMTGFQALALDLDRLKTRLDTVEVKLGLSTGVDKIRHNR